MNADALLDEAGICHFLGVGRSRLHELMTQSWFPKPLRVVPTNKKYWTTSQAKMAKEEKTKRTLPRNTRIAHTGRIFASLLQQTRLGNLGRDEFGRRFGRLVLSILEHKSPEEFAEQGGAVYDVAPYIHALLPELEANRQRFGDLAESLKLLLPEEDE